MSKIKKVIIVASIIATTLFTFNSCVDVSKLSSSGKMMLSYVLEEVNKASLNSINFIKSTGYSGDDISNISYTEEKDNEDNSTIISKFTIKENINLESSIFISNDLVNTSIQVTLVAPKDTNIDDLVNCSLYAFTSYYKNFEQTETETYKNYAAIINQAIQSPGYKINIKTEEENIEHYVQVNNDYISIISQSIISED